MTFSLLELQVLAGLAEGHTLSEIAERLHFSQPAISKVLRAAEQHAALPLVEHRGRRVQLTAAGADLGRTARLIAAQVDGIDGLVKDLQLGKKGSLRLVVSATPANYVLPAVVTEFVGMYPDVHVVMALQLQRDWDVVLHQGLDLGIGMYGAPTPPVGWVVEPLYEEEIVFFVPSDSPLARDPYVTPGALQGERLVGSIMSPYWGRIMERFRAQGLVVGRFTEVQAAESMKQLVAAGHGVGVNFGAVVWREIAEGRFTRLHVEGLSHREVFHLIRPETKHPLRMVRAFLDCLRRRVSCMFGPQPPQAAATLKANGRAAAGKDRV
jgi:DNA-binding transcriptional LysR family regulator